MPLIEGIDIMLLNVDRRTASSRNQNSSRFARVLSNELLGFRGVRLQDGRERDTGG